MNSGDTWVGGSNLDENTPEMVEMVWRAVVDERCTQLALHPHQLKTLIKNKPAPSKLEKIVIFGQRPSKDLIECLGTHTESLSNLYGSTEAPGTLVTTYYAGTRVNQFGFGLPFDGVEVKIVDDDGEIVPSNTHGELLVRSPKMCVGYFNDPDKNKEAFTHDGWYKTDDLARMSEEGSILVEGRKSDVIICKTVKIVPSDVENIINRCPGVEISVVVGTPHKDFFQEICACVVLQDNSTTTADKIRRFVDDFHADRGVSGKKAPSHYLMFDSFPTTHTGKLSRKQITEDAIAFLKEAENANTI